MVAHRAKSERGIKALPDGKFEYTIRFRGKLERKVFPTKGICKAQREKRKVELREGYYLPPKAPTLEDAVKKFLKWSKSSCRDSTQENDRWVAALWVASPALRGKNLDRITAGDVEKFKQEMRERTRPAPKSAGDNAPPIKIGPRSTDVALARLRRMFSLAVTWGLVRENPARKVPLLHEDRGRLRFLTHEEEVKLLEACSPKLALLVRFAIVTGMRRSEILALCPREVNFDAGVARLEGARTKAGRPRAVALSKEAREILRALPEPKKPEIPFFANRDGGVNERLYRSFPAAAKKAELEDVTFHDLRHTFASRLVMAGVNLATVQHLMGHKTIAMTMRYSHLAPGVEKEAVEFLTRGESIIKSIIAPFGAIEKSP